ncbi:MAG: ABC transporter substrate-binding protein [Caldilinea sp. CFX5]|nr:ABC transporter substrate-binding protein [Caldilinea sp. CFX5]
MTLKRSRRTQPLGLTLLLLLSLLIAACGGAPAAPTGGEQAAAPAADAAPAAAAPAGLKEVPRNRTLKLMRGGREGQHIDYELWNPYAVGANHQNGANIMYEPLAFYSAFADKELLWLAESYQYNEDSTELTIKTRQGIKWSDGVDFSAEDVAYTFSTLKEIGPAVRWGVDVQMFVESAEAIDESTVLIKFKVPAPRFFNLVSYKFDIGVYIVPKHIFEGQDWASFGAFDLAKGWPVTTGPFTVVASSPEQKIYDRRDTWWAAEQGLAPMPQMERIVQIPDGQEQQQAQALITNEIDTGFTLAPETFQTIFDQNEKITTHAGRQAPYGYLDWWPVSMYVNTEKAPFDNPDVRWAMSYFIDREQVVDIGWSGANTISRLPMPPYPPLMRYFDAAGELLEQYNTSEYNPDKGAELLQKAGFTKNGEGKWVNAAGEQLKFEAFVPAFLNGMGMVVVQQLQNQGIEVTPADPPDMFDRFTQGDYQAAFFGHGGSVNDPYFTLRLYQGASKAIPGNHQANQSRWSNPDYDKIVDEVYVTPMTDYDKLESLFVDAMEIWLPNLPDIPLTELYHRIGYNETYWTNWPTAENPYVNGASWHLTWEMVLWNLEAVEK